MRRVVVTGLGVVSPIGTGRPAFHAALREARPGVDLIRGFDASSFPTRIAAEVKDLDLAAVPLPADLEPALRRDRKSVFGVVAAREAVRDAFGAPPLLAALEPRRVAVIIASGQEIFHLEDVVAHVGHARIDGGALLRAVLADAPLRRLQIPSDLGARVIAREAGAAGLFAVNVSACAAGTQAVGEAFRAIQDGAADVALAGGYDSMVNPLAVGGFCLLGALSTANDLRGGASRPFDARRDGFVIGEGAAVLVLEEIEHARRRGARVRAEIRGYGSTLDAYRVTDPSPGHAGAVAAMRAALEDAGLAPAAVDYVNAHGTGTPKNDPAETAALHTLLGEGAGRVPVSSTKSQIGHLLGAAGAVELVATIFALEEGLLPATINLTHPDPECDLDYVPGTPRPATPRIALSSSFGFGGQNAALVVAWSEGA
ncbi:MAG TPA: beta-ketoacyl-[acyl-carrier-protein] synthase family protein [Polyangia bacterium]